MYNVLKYACSIILMLMGVGFLFSGFFGGLLLLISGLILLPPISDLLKSKISFWQNKPVRIIATLSLAFLGFVISGAQGASQDYKSKPRSKKGVLVNYIKNDTTDRSIKNLKELGAVGELFGNGNYATIHPKDGYITEEFDTINNVSLLTLNPRLGIDERDNAYLKEIDEKGTLKDYIMKFKVNANDSLISKETVISYSSSDAETYLNREVPDIGIFIKKDAVEVKEAQLAMEQRAKADREAYDKRVKEFEENCISGWDGSHTKLKSLIEDNLNDPDSFEHDETSYRLIKDYAIVVMNYKARNDFNALVRGSVTAKVRLNDCEVLEIIE